MSLGPKVIVGMTTSLDGFVADQNGSADALYSDLFPLHGTTYMDEMIEETAAVVMGRRTFAMMDDPDLYVGNYEFQCPIFVLTRNPPAVPPKQDDRLTFTFVTDGVESAIRQARAAAAGGAVTVVGGVSVVHQLFAAGLVDELRLDLQPLFLGRGLRFLEDMSPDVRLEKLAAIEVGSRTSLRYRVLK